MCGFLEYNPIRISALPVASASFGYYKVIYVQK